MEGRGTVVEVEPKGGARLGRASRKGAPCEGRKWRSQRGKAGVAQGHVISVTLADPQFQPLPPFSARSSLRTSPHPGRPLVPSTAPVPFLAPAPQHSAFSLCLPEAHRPKAIPRALPPQTGTNRGRSGREGRSAKTTPSAAGSLGLLSRLLRISYQLFSSSRVRSRREAPVLGVLPCRGLRV